MIKLDMIKYLFFILILTINYACSVQNLNDRKWNVRDGYIPDKDTAVKVAEIIWVRIYGNEINNKKPFQAELINKKIWLVKGSLPQGIVGGVPYIKIQKKDGKILEVYHTK